MARKQRKNKNGISGVPMGGSLCVCLPSKAPIILMIFVVFFRRF